MTAWSITRVKSSISSIIYYLLVFSMIIPFQMVMFTMSKMANILRLDNPDRDHRALPGVRGRSVGVRLQRVRQEHPAWRSRKPPRIDGCNPIQTFFLVVFPILKPIDITVAILNAMWIWNDYLLPYLVIGNNYKTIPIAVQYLQGGYGSRDMGAMMAMLVLAIIPIVIFYLSSPEVHHQGRGRGRCQGLASTDQAANASGAASRPPHVCHPGRASGVTTPAEPLPRPPAPDRPADRSASAARRPAPAPPTSVGASHPMHGMKLTPLATRLTTNVPSPAAAAGSRFHLKARVSRSPTSSPIANPPVHDRRHEDHHPDQHERDQADRQRQADQQRRDAEQAQQPHYTRDRRRIRHRRAITRPTPLAPNITTSTASAARISDCSSSHPPSHSGEGLMSIIGRVGHVRSTNGNCHCGTPWNPRDLDRVAASDHLSLDTRLRIAIDVPAEGRHVHP